MLLNNQNRERERERELTRVRGRQVVRLHFLCQTQIIIRGIVKYGIYIVTIFMHTRVYTCRDISTRVNKGVLPTTPI